MQVHTIRFWFIQFAENSGTFHSGQPNGHGKQKYKFTFHPCKEISCTFSAPGPLSKGKQKFCAFFNVKK